METEKRIYAQHQADGAGHNCRSAIPKIETSRRPLDRLELNNTHRWLVPLADGILRPRKRNHAK
jgi:hypothetical protein